MRVDRDAALPDGCLASIPSSLQVVAAATAPGRSPTAHQLEVAVQVLPGYSFLWFPCTYNSAYLALQDLRIENLKLINDLAMFGDDNFADQDAAEDVKDELKFDLA